MDDRHYRQLVKRYLEGTSTDEELEVFAHLLKEGKLDTILAEALDTDLEINEEDLILAIKPNKSLPWLKYAVAIAVLLVSITVAYFYKVHVPKEEVTFRMVQSANEKHKNDVLPGGNKAILTLSDGEKIILDKANDGQLAKQGNISIEKIKDGYLSYQALSNKNLNIQQDQALNEITDYNTISTPKTGQYQIILSDGTKVWLNSFSSITFPTRFSGKERKVTTMGEVYFEVIQDNKSPFIVETKGQRIEVLGTSFNVNAYEDERAIRTTLVNGSIKVTAGNSSKILDPGQQAEVVDQQINIHPDMHIASIVAWKNGFFSFENTDLPTLMRQLSRWYDIHPVYQGKVGAHEFVGEIPRKSNLSSVLKILEWSGVHFRIEGQNLLIYPDNKQK